MKVYNLTDVSTPALESRQLVNVAIQVAPGQVVKPGEVIEVARKVSTVSYLKQQFVGAGAVAIDRLPDEYKGKARQARPAAPPPAPLSAVRAVDED